MKKLLLDKILKVGTVYETDKRECWRILKIGTNSSGKAYLKIDNAPTTELHSIIAPLRPTSDNVLPLLDLGTLWIAVPPQTKIEPVGDSGSYIRVVGEKLILDAHESPPSDIMTRKDMQSKHYITYLENTFSLGVDEAWSADIEYTVIEYTPKTIEMVRLNNLLMTEITGNTVNPGDFGIKFYLDDIPLEYIVGENIQHGIDVLSCPRPPSTTKGMIPFSLKDFPIDVLGDHTLKIVVRNTSGASKSPASGSKWSVTITAVVEYKKQG